ncbi:HTH domain-containing protein [Natrinema pallidum]|uniref:HTH domain-containing protein n=1 Tax=Natrinema pallidum TaxID=69527 RepID=A0A4P9TMK6_9EURY|nr:HTH domain-containing protein [Natrinema pallidum]QCW05300.1 HTH domain-containing protein [Natrinema pallidum]
MTIDPGPADYDGRGDLPDALAFVKPNYARAYVAFKRIDTSLTGPDLADRLDCSKPTAYRYINRLSDLGLITESEQRGTFAKPTPAYTTADTPSERIVTDGGTDESHR